jgi:hypothetical protein
MVSECVGNHIDGGTENESEFFFLDHLTDEVKSDVNMHGTGVELVVFS